MSVRSPHYLFVGNAGEEAVMRVAARFELFRATFSGLFPAFGLHAPIPTRVIVFKNYQSFRSFRPLSNERPMDFTGYYQPGLDVNYITLSLDIKAEDTFVMLFTSPSISCSPIERGRCRIGSTRDSRSITARWTSLQARS